MNARQRNEMLVGVSMLLASLIMLAASMYVGAKNQERRIDSIPKAVLLDARPAPRASRSDDRILDCIGYAESRNNYRAVRKNPPRFGRHQWAQTTWDSAGGKDYDGVRPDKAPPAIQDKRAHRLVEIRRNKGLDPFGKWTTARRCR